MDQIKIGKFIAERRKSIPLTQMQLAEQLHITDRAVSKWETGKAMPDAAIMPELCHMLGISINDLFCGEVVTMENYNRELEKNLLDMTRQKEQADKHLLMLEIVVGVTATVLLITLIIVAALAPMADWLRAVLIVLAFGLFLAGCFCALRIEQVAGYYECGLCSHRYVPTYRAVNMAPHKGRTRYMRCPECGKKSWQKKVISKE